MTRQKVAPMPSALKPIKRIWKPKAPHAPKVEPVRPLLDIYGYEIFVPEVQEKNSDSIWDTYEALQAAAAERESQRKRE